MIINHNIAAMNTYRQLTNNNVNTGKSLEKLSSGLRINRAGDDAAGLAISEKMRAQIRGLDQASRNSQDAISLIQTAEGAMSETHSILQRMRELAVQSSSDTNTDTDRGTIQKEINQLTSEINRIGNTTEFNTKKLLNGDRADTYKITGTSFGSGAASLSLSGVGTATLNGTLATGSYSIEITKSVTSSTVTNSGIAVSGVHDGAETLTGTLSDAKFANNASKPVFGGNAISITSGTGTWAGVSGTTSGQLSITLSGSGIVVHLDNGSGVSITDTIVADASGKYTYNNAGVSFTITDTTGWDSGAANQVTYSFNDATNANTATATVGTDLQYFSSTTDVDAKNAFSAVSITSGVADGDYSITFKNSGGNLSVHVSGTNGSGQIINDTLSGVTSASGISYNAFGISFNLSGADFGGNSGSGEFHFTVTNEQKSYTTTTTYETSYSAVVKNASGTTLASGSIGTSAPNVASGVGISGAFSGDLGGVHLSFGNGDVPKAGTYNFDVQNTTSGENNSMAFQIGANENQSLSLSISDMRASALGLTSSSTASGFQSSMEVTDGTDSTNKEYALDVSSASGAMNAITVIDNAINSVSSERSKLGAVQNRLEHTINNLGTSSENLSAAESRIRDVDMAKQMMDFTKNNILTQAAQAMLAQANQQPQGVLQLLR